MTDTIDRTDALTHFADVWSDGLLLDNIGTSLTCTETEALADLLDASGYPDAAAGLIEAHSEGDDEGDLHYKGDD